MRVECKNCGCRIGEMAAFGGMNQMLRLFCGALVFYLAAWGVRYGAPLLRPGWFALAVVVSGLAVGLGALFWGFCPGFFSWWRYRKTLCPECGHRRWSWGFTEGWH